ncbi:hypothetical protein D3C76_915860 [compost metagenome]
MNILKSNLAAKIGGLLRTFKMRANAAGILCRTIHQAYAIRAEQLAMNEIIMRCRLLWREQLTDHTARHRQQTVLNPRFALGRVQHRLRLIRIFKIQEAGDHIGL